MHLLRTLGSVDLRNSDGNPVGAVLAQPKRLAVLIYLAAANGRYQRRDTLLGLFWPEFDEEHARGALRKALHYLKAALGPDVVLRRGIEELAVDPVRLSLDTIEFERAIAEGRLDEALELYGGEFLSGFILDDVPQFEHWLSGERRRLHQLAVHAAGELAERWSEAGKDEQARVYAEAALALAPTGEAEVRRLITLVDRLGDRGSALRVYQEFAARLHDEFGVEPSSVTRELVAKIRQRGDPTDRGERDERAIVADTDAEQWAGSVELEPEQRAGTAGLEPAQQRNAEIALEAPAVAAGAGHVGYVSTRSARHSTGRLRKGWPWSLVRIGLLVAVLSSGVAAWLSANEREPATSHVAVLPFSVQAPTPLQYLDEGLAVLLAMRLDGGGGLRTIEPGRVMQHTGQGEHFGSNRELARKSGAGLYVTGHVTRIAENISVEAALYSIESERPIVRATVVGAEAALLTLADSIAQQLLAAYLRDRGLQLSESAALSTSSLEALKQYLAGEEELREGRYEAAVELYQRAIDIDSTFALAHFRHAVGANWLGRMTIARSSIERAELYSDRLNEHGRRLVRGMHAALTERFEDAERFYQETVELYPTDTEAWFELGDAMFHGRPPRGGSIASARDAFEQALRLDPEHLASLVHLTRLAAWEGNRDEVDVLTTRILRDQRANTHYTEALLFRMVTLKDTDAQRRLMTLTATQPLPARLLDAAWRVAAYTGESGAVDAAVKAAFPTSAMSAYSVGAHLLGAHLAASRGDWSLAEERLRSFERSAPAAAAITRALFALQPGARTTAQERTRIESLLERMKNARPGHGQFYIGSMATDTMADWIFDYYAAQLALQRGDRAPAEEAIGRIPHDSRLTAPARAQLEALLLEHAGDRAAAIRLLQAAALEDGGHPWSSVLIPRASLRVLLVRMLESAGRTEEARRWRASILQDFSFDLIYTIRRNEAGAGAL